MCLDQLWPLYLRSVSAESPVSIYRIILSQYWFTFRWAPGKFRPLLEIKCCLWHDHRDQLCIQCIHIVHLTCIRIAMLSFRACCIQLLEIQAVWAAQEFASISSKDWRWPSGGQKEYRLHGHIHRSTWSSRFSCPLAKRGFHFDIQCRKDGHTRPLSRSLNSGWVSSIQVCDTLGAQFILKAFYLIIIIFNYYNSFKLNF